MPDYSNGKIYKITSPNCIEVYIGSTTQSLNDRFMHHIYDCKTDNRNLNSKIVIDKGDAIIELIELFPCEFRTELRRREGAVQKTTLNCCNYKIAGRTDKEYYVENIDRIKEKDKQYRINNVDKIKEKNKMYNTINRDIINQKRREYRLKMKNEEIETVI